MKSTRCLKLSLRIFTARCSAPLIPINRFFARYKFVTYLLTYLLSAVYSLSQDARLTVCRYCAKKSNIVASLFKT